MKANALRKEFLEFFKRHGHSVLPSASLVPDDDPSVLLTTAGMQQFKAYFKNPALADERLNTRRVATVQKSFRTTDIDEVGDTSHLTFFEMLGNFSFGDYFKEEAIAWAWEFMARVLAISKDRMRVSIFSGDANVPRDDVSETIWKKLGVPAECIRTAGREDNFWGPTGQEGPCGPTTEIYVDGVEVWNIVFNEYYCGVDKTLTKLEHPGVDTGMGFERLLSLLNGAGSVYDTDVFTPILEVVKEYIGVPSQTQPLDSKAIDRAARIIADHIRASSFLIVEGVRPSNIKQGYILRRLLRRIVRYEDMLQLRDGYLAPLVASVSACFKEAYPELAQSSDVIKQVIESERVMFRHALGRGLKMFERMLRLNNNQFTGRDAFTLYERYGFPFELVAELAKERSIDIDKADFDAAFAEHQRRSRGGQ